MIMQNCLNSLNRNSNFVLKEHLTEINIKKVSAERGNQYLDFVIDPSFQGVIRLFVLYFPTRKIKNYNFIINRQTFFD